MSRSAHYSGRLRALVFITALWLFPAQAMTIDFLVKDQSLVPLPEFPDGVVRSHWTFKGYENCRVVGIAVNLAESGETEGYFATTADECGWIAASGPIWVVERVDGALQLVLATRGYWSRVSQESRHGLRHIIVSAVLAGAVFESVWEFNGTNYVNTREEVELDP